MQSMTILEKGFCNRSCEVLAHETFAPSKWRKGTIGLRSSDLDCGWLWTWEVSSGNNSSRRWDHLGHRKKKNNNKGRRLWSKSSTWHREFAEENDDEKLGFITAHSLLNPSIFFFRFLQKLESLVKKRDLGLGGNWRRRCGTWWWKECNAHSSRQQAGSLLWSPQAPSSWSQRLYFLWACRFPAFSARLF